MELISGFNYITALTEIPSYLSNLSNLQQFKVLFLHFSMIDVNFDHRQDVNNLPDIQFYVQAIASEFYYCPVNLPEEAFIY